MLHSYLGWTNLKHYLDNFIHVLAPDLATPQRLQEETEPISFLPIVWVFHAKMQKTWKAQL